jgi:hypothetical protein
VAHASPTSISYVVSDVLAFSRSLDVDSNGNAEPELSTVYILSNMDK